MNFISNKLITSTFVVLLIYLTIDFLQKKEEKFWQFNYDWKNTEILQNLGDTQVDSVQANYLEITIDKQPDSIVGHTLEFTNGENRYYFNFENAYILNQRIRFTGGFWILNEGIASGTNANAKIIELPLKKTGGTNINIITDSQLLWRGGRSFRKWLKEKNPDLNFVGEKRDVYGFPYNGEIVNTIEKTYKRSSKIPKADIYIISLGTHESQAKIQESINNYKKLIKKLKQKNNSAEVFIINVPPSLDEKRNTYNKKLNTALATLAKVENVQLIDFYKLVKDNYRNLLIEDKIHYQSKAYKMLVNQINKRIHGIK